MCKYAKRSASSGVGRLKYNSSSGKDGKSKKNAYDDPKNHLSVASRSESAVMASWYFSCNEAMGTLAPCGGIRVLSPVRGASGGVSIVASCSEGGGMEYSHAVRSDGGG